MRGSLQEISAMQKCVSEFGAVFQSQQIGEYGSTASGVVPELLSEESAHFGFQVRIVREALPLFVEDEPANGIRETAPKGFAGAVAPAP